MTLDVLDLLSEGPVDYAETWQRQRALHAEVAAGLRPDTVLLLEHRSVYTAGKRTEPQERPQDGTPVIDVDRGGKITWHGPGQLVGYPIVRLPEAVGVVDYVRRLEEAMIGAVRRLRAGHRPGPRTVGRLAGRGRRAARAQDRRDRRPGRRRHDHARLRDQRGPRPGGVREHHPLRTGRGRASPRWPRSSAGRSRSRRWRRPAPPPHRTCWPSRRTRSPPTSGDSLS